MTTTTSPKPRREPVPMNGVDTPALFATLSAVGAQPELAQFTWRATNTWQRGTHNRTRIEAFRGAGGEQKHAREFSFDADHPAVLVGRDLGITPVEYLLVALTSCLTPGLGNIAAARGVQLHSVESTIEGDMDLLGILGLSDRVRNGYSQMRVHFRVAGDAPAEKLRELVAQSQARSAVYDMLTNGTDIQITVDAA